MKMRIVDSDGELRTYSLEEHGEYLMRAIQGNFGLFGIIWDITFKAPPLMIVKHMSVYETVGRIMHDDQFLKDLLANNWSVELFWFPFNSMTQPEAVEAIFDGDVDHYEWNPMQDKMWIKIINPIENAGNINKGRKFYNFRKFRDWLSTTGYNVADAVVKFEKRPNLIPWLTKFQHDDIERSWPPDDVWIQQLPHALHYRSQVTDIKVSTMEFAIDVGHNFQNLRKAMLVSKYLQ